MAKLKKEKIHPIKMQWKYAKKTMKINAFFCIF